MLAISSASVQAEEAPDRIFVNARVWTAESAHPAAEAFAVAGDASFPASTTRTGTCPRACGRRDRSRHAASTQAIFATPVPSTLENYAPLIGPERASRAQPFRLFDAAGALQAFGSDYPVYPMDPLLGIYTAITRQTRDGTPGDGWFPANRIDLETALLHYTRDAAYASFDELDKGTISVGKYADFVVLSRDILTETPQRLLDTKVLLTVMSGRETYRAPQLADGAAIEPARGWLESWPHRLRPVM
jgi:predicted amidohydrolase YtcJ